MRNIKKYSFFSLLSALILGLTVSTVHAQVQEQTTEQTNTYKLIGKVVDASNGEALSEVKVKVMDPEQETAARTQTESETRMGNQAEGENTETTNDQGEFTFTELASGEHTIKIDYDGYETWERKVNLNQDSQLTIELKPSS